VWALDDPEGQYMPNPAHVLLGTDKPVEAHSLLTGHGVGCAVLPGHVAPAGQMPIEEADGQNEPTGQVMGAVEFGGQYTPSEELQTRALDSTPPGQYEPAAQTGESATDRLGHVSHGILVAGVGQ